MGAPALVSNLATFCTAATAFSHSNSSMFAQTQFVVMTAGRTFSLWATPGCPLPSSFQFQASLRLLIKAAKALKIGLRRKDELLSENDTTDAGLLTWCTTFRQHHKQFHLHAPLQPIPSILLNKGNLNSTVNELRKRAYGTHIDQEEVGLLLKEFVEHLGTWLGTCLTLSLATKYIAAIPYTTLPLHLPHYPRTLSKC